METQTIVNLFLAKQQGTQEPLPVVKGNTVTLPGFHNGQCLWGDSSVRLRPWSLCRPIVARNVYGQLEIFKSAQQAVNFAYLV